RIFLRYPSLGLPYRALAEDSQPQTLPNLTNLPRLPSPRLHRDRRDEEFCGRGLTWDRDKLIIRPGRPAIARLCTARLSPLPPRPLPRPPHLLPPVTVIIPAALPLPVLPLISHRLSPLPPPRQTAFSQRPTSLPLHHHRPRHRPLPIAILPLPPTPRYLPSRPLLSWKHEIPSRM
ncbi:hypothetical protein ACJ73_07708, partial [Blastomyces percursus]